MPWNDVLRRRMQPLTAAMTSNRIIVYAIFSTGAMMGAILNACRNQSNFYAVTVYLSRSGRSLLVSYNHHVYSWRLKTYILRHQDSGQFRFSLRVGMWKGATEDILWAITTSWSRGTVHFLINLQNWVHLWRIANYSGYTTRLGCSSQNHYWLSQYSETSSTFRSFWCLDSCYSWSVSTGWWLTGLSRYVL